MPDAFTITKSHLADTITHTHYTQTCIKNTFESQIHYQHTVSYTQRRRVTIHMQQSVKQQNYYFLHYHVTSNTTAFAIH